MAKLTNCKTCGAEIATSAKTCPSCGAKNKASTPKKLIARLVVVFLILVFIVAIAGTSSDGGTSVTDEKGNTQTTLNKEAVSFEGDCGISASAEIYANVINYPEISISIKNNSNKKIEAIQFYIVPYNVYGEELDTLFTENKLKTDTAISAGKSNKVSYQLLEQNVETVDLYVYSVYFEDGTEWGNRDATKTNILKYGVPIIVDGES